MTSSSVMTSHQLPHNCSK